MGILSLDMRQEWHGKSPYEASQSFFHRKPRSLNFPVSFRSIGFSRERERKCPFLSSVLQGKSGEYHTVLEKRVNERLRV